MHTTAITKADRAALENLWEAAGVWAADTWTAHNANHFDGQLKFHGIVFGLTPHGHNLAHTSNPDGDSIQYPRITLHPALLDPRGDAWGMNLHLGARHAEHVLLHEMVHVALFDAGIENTKDKPHHNTQEWCDQIMRISTRLGLNPIKAAPVNPRRVDGKVVRLAQDGFLSRDDLAHWPHTLMPADYYNRGGRMPVPI